MLPLYTYPCLAGLNFVGNAEYKIPEKEKHNVSPYEFIPWILGQCATAKEAKELLQSINLVDIPFNSEKLADAFCFRIPGYGVHSYKSNAHKTGLGGQVAGKPDGPHSPAVFFFPR